MGSRHDSLSRPTNIPCHPLSTRIMMTKNLYSVWQNALKKGLGAWHRPENMLFWPLSNLNERSTDMMVQDNNIATTYVRMLIASGDGFVVPNRSVSVDSGDWPDLTKQTTEPQTQRSAAFLFFQLEIFHNPTSSRRLPNYLRLFVLKQPAGR